MSLGTKILKTFELDSKFWYLNGSRAKSKISSEFLFGSFTYYCRTYRENFQVECRGIRQSLNAFCSTSDNRTIKSIVKGPQDFRTMSRKLGQIPELTWTQSQRASAL